MEELEAPGVWLELEIERAFDEFAVLQANSHDAIAAHPVRRHAEVRGAVTTHRPAFSQMNEKVCVIESVDFTSSRVRVWRDHAGFIAYMSRDICGQHGDKALPISIIRGGPEDLESPVAKSALSALRNEGEVLNWQSSQEREQFLNVRREVALDVRHD